MPGATHDLGHAWYQSTVLLFAFCFYMWPQYFAASFAARSGNIVRRNAVTQVVGFMSMENGLILAATGARGMPLVVEVSVAFSVLIALFVFAVFVFRIRERFDTIDIEALDRMRGDRR